jgi:hypothetical protein
MATITEQLADFALVRRRRPCAGAAHGTLCAHAGTVAQLQHEVEGKAAALLTNAASATA